ncbi:MAG: helix-turn-helix domain-containing protein [Crenarchaeota archaeon]|nr:helix-turn-helix domain-containing protein [Thermoproteota archaeon]MCR8453417.1 helix-turn-helix domain-containing protein [Thermoproteota archaeon]MCR8454938.1 helix-turn-helix domain-containing protein [Thermoproteota archaeon]MCR8471024.1 helix-turn-helix domain-containing protein [Thermoproteota archaeon]MCR8471840.1 helix-turn-helix domain-containing protein [Thermoproteota archaeon]
MPRRKGKEGLTCKNCGSKFRSQKEVKIIKIWHTFSPFPDKDGNIAINVFATWECPICGARGRDKISSIKGGFEYKGKNYTEILAKIIYELKETTVEELSKRLNMSEETISKALKYLIAEGQIRAKLDGKKVIASSGQEA